MRFSVKPIKKAILLANSLRNSRPLLGKDFAPFLRFFMEVILCLSPLR
jgi:hypothetical protein